jgi:spore maturation protein CgeB
MRILYIGQLDSGGTCLDRMRSLQRLGHKVTGSDVCPFQSRFRLLRSAQWRLKPRLLLGSLNANLSTCVAKSGRFDLVWVDKGVWIFPETVAHLRNVCGGRAVHFTPDPQFLFHRSRHFVRSIPYYDYFVTTKVFEIRLYREAGARNVILSPQSFCPVRYAIPKPRLAFSADVGFVGHYERHYGMHLSALSTEGAVQVWGNGWVRAGKRGQVPTQFVRGNGLWGTDYVDALASFKIGLGLLSKYIPEQHTTRSFEIPAAGTFLLAERTGEHQKFFEEGREAEFFGSPEELVSKARFYLSNDLARRRIAEGGRERCHRSGYDTDTVLSNVLREIA